MSLSSYRVEQVVSDWNCVQASLLFGYPYINSTGYGDCSGTYTKPNTWYTYFFLYIWVPVETKRGGDDDLNKLTSKRTGVERKQMNGEINSSTNSVKQINHYTYIYQNPLISITMQGLYLVTCWQMKRSCHQEVIFWDETKICDSGW